MCGVVCLGALPRFFMPQLQAWLQQHNPAPYQPSILIAGANANCVFEGKATIYSSG